MKQSVAPLNNVHREHLRHGIECFNREEFFECHEILEEAWRGASAGQRVFLQGLIQIAVAFHHLRHNNSIGARKLLGEGMSKLIQFGPQHEGMEVTAFVERLEAVRIALNSDEAMDSFPLPKIAFQATTDSNLHTNE